MKIHRYLKRWHPLALILIFCLSLAWMSTGVSADKRSYTREDAEFIAKAVWGEARNCDASHQAAVVWCILNRVDSALFPNTIREVVTQKHQFAGYHAGNPVDPDILALACDVLARWSIEPSCMARRPPMSFRGTPTGKSERFSRKRRRSWAAASSGTLPPG